MFILRCGLGCGDLNKAFAILQRVSGFLLKGDNGIKGLAVIDIDCLDVSTRAENAHSAREPAEVTASGAVAVILRHINRM